MTSSTWIQTINTSCPYPLHFLYPLSNLILSYPPFPFFPPSVTSITGEPSTLVWLSTGGSQTGPEGCMQMSRTSHSMFSPGLNPSFTQHRAPPIYIIIYINIRGCPPEWGMTHSNGRPHRRHTFKARLLYSANRNLKRHTCNSAHHGGSARWLDDDFVRKTNDGRSY